jgi:sugar (pentulose or hexulose) kinase
MTVGWIIVLDIGKSFSKVSLWDEAGHCIAQRARANPRLESAGRLTLDFIGTEHWLREVLREFATMGPVSAIVPVAHGAAMTLIGNGRLLEPPLDYEWTGVAAQRAAYDRQRDPFIATGSPSLPAGLNLGMQLHWLESIGSPGAATGEIIPWPQYWAWLLSGVASTEVTSLGCHTDLWRPYDRGPSELAVRRGWAKRFAPITSADAVLGTLQSAWIDATGLSRDVEVYCGLHDSNAALLHARSHPELKGRDATILSTGTWFVAMRTPLSKSDSGPIELPEARDCLVNVDVAGTPIPTARFMGGREIEVLAGTDAPLRSDAGQSAAIEAVESGHMILPSYTSGVGPYPNAPLREISPISAGDDAMVMAQLYAALLTDASLDLIGSCDTLVVDGRFSKAPVFVQALANLRTKTRVMVSPDEQGVARGAIQLAGQAGHAALKVISPLPVDMSGYRARWRDLAEHATHG